MRVPSLVLCLALSPACAATSSGCEGFDPRSAPLDAGSTTTLEVEVAGDRVSPIDVNGGYYAQPDGVRLRPGPPAASPRSTSATVSRQGDGLTLLVDGQRFALEGPLGCD